MKEPISGDLQDGMLAYYLEQVKLSDATIEARLEREPFDLLNVPSNFLNDLQNRRRHRGLDPLPDIPAIMSRKP